MAQPLALDSAPAGEAAGWRRNEDLIDALPYVDTLSDVEKTMVDRLIREEMKNSEKKVGDYLQELPPARKLKLEGHPVLESELARLRAGGSMEALDMTRILLEPPPLEKRNDYGAWKRALDNAHSQLEHQYNRLVNLELLKKYGATVWSVHNTVLEAHSNRLEQEAADVGQRIDQINRERKLQQTAVGQELADLQAEWRALVAKNRQIELACGELEAEIKLLQPPVGA